MGLDEFGLLFCFFGIAFVIGSLIIGCILENKKNKEV